MVNAVLYLWGEQLVPDEISSLVGFPPTSCKLKGQKTELSNGDLSFAKTGMWALQSKDLGLGSNLVDHVAFLAVKICQNVQGFVERGIVQQARMSLLISHSASEQRSSESMELPPNIINILSMGNVSLMFTVIWPDLDNLNDG
jgi:hypothetical protein